MIKFSPKKIAIFYDWLYTWGGAERVLLDLIEIFPTAEIYTTYYNPKKTKWLPKNTKIHHLNIPHFFENKLSILSPFMPILLEKYNFDKYDIVLSMGTIFNNCLLTKPKTKYISYTLTPNRYLKKYPIYKPVDKIFSKRPDKIISISKTIQSRITESYNINSDIIYPGIDTKEFKPKVKSSNKYYLVVSRLVPHKKVDQAIKACINLKKKLIIVGTGREEEKLKLLAKNYSDIEFRKNISDIELVNLYQNCKALISPQVEDFGISNIECMACGKPVIALDSGGNAETIKHLETGYLYKNQTTACLQESILKFQKLIFTQEKCTNRAQYFSKTKFMLDWNQEINEKY